MNIGHNRFGDSAIGHERHRALANQRRIDALPAFVDDPVDLHPRREGPRPTHLVAVIDDQHVREVEPRYGNLQPDLTRPGIGSGHCSDPHTYHITWPNCAELTHPTPT